MRYDYFELKNVIKIAVFARKLIIINKLRYLCHPAQFLARDPVTLKALGSALKAARNDKS